MSGEYTQWLDQLQAARRGGFPIAPIDRGSGYFFTFDFDKDFSADSFKAALRTAPVDDVTDTPALATFTVNVGAFANGLTPVTISLSAATVSSAIPADGDGDAIVTLYWDLLHHPSGGAEYRLGAGYVLVLSGVTDSAA